MTIPAPRPDLGLREGYHSPQVDVPVRLNTNESPFAPPQAWLDRLAEECRRIEWNRYPDRGATELRQGLAELHGVTLEQVFCANGSNEVLQCLCLAYGGPGRSVAVFEPTYALHSHIAHLTGTAVVEARRREDFSLDPDTVADVMAGADPVITFLCSPNNPTGLSEPPSVVQSVLGMAPGVVVVDEAYGQFADWSAASLVSEDRPLVVTRTFSKTWSMAAARLGYLIGPSEIVAALERVALPYHLDAFKQVAGLLALQFVAEMEERVALIVRERQRILTALRALPLTVWPSQSNFILFRPENRKADEVWEELLQRGVLVRNTAGWPGLTGSLRVTVGSAADNGLFLDALREVVGG